MRRGRNLREYRQKVLQERSKMLASPKTVAKAKDRKRRLNSFRDRLKQKAEHKTKIKYDYSVLPAFHALPLINFTNHGNYSFSYHRPLVICHVIESMGLGGAQTMMLELINGLNQYYGASTKNICVHLGRKEMEKDLYSSYGIKSTLVRPSDLKMFCNKNDVDIVLQHRIAVSKCLKPMLPGGTKYVLINHTWHNMSRMQDFMHCDAYISVCQFLHGKTEYPDFIHQTRKFIILNGVENSYIKDLESESLAGSLKTGRCHRMVPSKFRIDSLQWMKNAVLKSIPGFSHYMIGNNREAKILAKKHNFLHYMGSITDRQKKMSIIKALDVYFYETFQDEGASVAILESLASGVPVLCKSLGGCPELIKNGVNGFLVKDRTEYLIRLRQLSNAEYRAKVKEQVQNDFESRLHIKHTACKYVQLFEALVDANTPNN